MENKYIHALIDDCKQALAAVPEKDFVMQSPDDIMGISSAIYVIEELGGDPRKTFDDFLKFKNESERKCPKPNKPSSVLYVGSSTTNLKRRLEQHLGNGPKATYALNLNCWFKGEYRISIKEYRVPRSILQILEDNLARQLGPAFGKLGGNSK